MPRVPTTPFGTVAPAQTTGARFQPVDNNGGAFGALGEGLSNIGKAVGDYAQAQDKIDDMLDDTVSRDLAMRYQEKAAPLVTEYNSLTGLNAVNRRAEIDAELARLRDETLGGAQEGRQRRYTEARLDPLHLSNTNRVGEHSIAQAVKYRDDTFEAQKVRYGELAGEHWDQPELFQEYVNSGLAVISDQADAQGWSPEMRAAVELDWQSGLHKTVVQNMIVAEDYEAASAYLEAHSDEMDAADELTLSDQIKPGLDYIQADDDAKAAYARIQGVEPTTATVEVGGGAVAADVGSAEWWQSVFAITLSTESNNQRYDKDGNLLTSPKGAQGEMQVMPDTQRDPGYGVRPAQDNSPEEKARVGRDYLQMLHKRYGGDTAKMWAAYNAGPSRIDNLIEKHGDNWLAYAPKETRDYVAKNQSALGDKPAQSAPKEETVSFKWQNPLGDKGRTSSKFGEQRKSGPHSGWDLAAKEGTPINPMGPGKVKKVGFDAASGNFIIIDHGNGITSSYSHLKEKPELAVGAPVDLKSTVGLVGNTGRSTGPHVHVVVRKDGVRIDPESILGQEATGKTGGTGEKRTVTVPGVENKGAVYAELEKMAAEQNWSPQRLERAKQKADRDIARDQEVRRIAESEADKQADDIVLQLGDDFTDISQIPTEVLNGMSHEGRNNLTRVAQSNRDRKETVQSDSDDYIVLHTMSISDPEGFAALNLSQYKDKVTPNEFTRLVTYQATARKNAEDSAKADADAKASAEAKEKARRSRESGKIGASVWTDIGRRTAGNKDIDDREKRNIYDTMYPFLQRRYMEKGFLDDADYEAAYRWSTRAVPVNVTSSFAGFNTGTSQAQRPLYELTIDHIPASTRKRIEASRKAKGLPVDDESIMKDYLAFKGVKGYW